MSANVTSQDPTAGPLHKAARKVATFSSGAAACIAGLAYAGWWMGHPEWVNVLPGLADMQPTTAVSILCLSGGMLALGSRASLMRVVLASIPLFLAAASILSLLAGSSLTADQLFGLGDAVDLDVFPGRMSPPTSVCCILLAVSLLWVVREESERRFTLATFPAVLAAGCGGYFVLEYVAGGSPGYGWATSVRMGINTALCVVLLSLGLLAHAYRWNTDLRRSRWKWPALTMLVQAAAVACLWSVLDVSATDGLRDRLSVHAAEHAELVRRKDREDLKSLEALAGHLPAALGTREHAIWQGRAAEVVRGSGFAWLAWIPENTPPEFICGAEDCPAPLPSAARLRASAAGLLEKVAVRTERRPSVDSAWSMGPLGEQCIAVVHRPGTRGAPDVLLAVSDLLLATDVDHFDLERWFDVEVVLPVSDSQTEPIDLSPYAVVTELSETRPGWKLILTPTASMVRASYSGTPILVLAIGMLLAGLCGTTLHYYLQSVELRKLRENDLSRLQLVLNQLSEGVAFATRDGTLEFINTRAREILGDFGPGSNSSEWCQIYGLLTPDGKHPFPHDELPLVRAMRGECVDDVEVGFWDRERSRLGHIVATARPVWDETGEHRGGVVVFRDISSIRQAREAQAAMEVQLRQGQKMEAIGQLAAGIAHEMNTPAQYVSDNLSFIRDSFETIMSLLSELERLRDTATGGPESNESIQGVLDALEKADLDFLLEEVPSAIEQSHEGISRVTKIVRAMRDFAHPGSPDKQLVDLAHVIQSTVTVARNEWKYVAEVETDFDEGLHEVLVIPGEFNQVILNLIVNAAHAIAETTSEGDPKGKIRIKTARDGPWAVISVSDTGPGIPEEVRARVFEPFFTTKEVGKGTGQGLAIVHSIVVDKHNGRVTILGGPGEGTTFEVRLPLASDGAEVVATAE